MYLKVSVETYCSCIFIGVRRRNDSTLHVLLCCIGFQYALSLCRSALLVEGAADSSRSIGTAMVPGGLRIGY